MSTAFRKAMSHAEFFAWAERQDGRYEFDGFQPVAMVGGTNAHGAITRNLIGQLYNRLRGTRCHLMTAEGGGVATTGGRIRYPEATVSCSPFKPKERLFPRPGRRVRGREPSTARVDQVLKLREYHAVPTIKRYILVEQTGIALTVHSRIGLEPWATLPLVTDDTLACPEIGIELAIGDLYEGVAFDE